LLGSSGGGPPIIPASTYRQEHPARTSAMQRAVAGAIALQSVKIESLDALLKVA
jgi:hypothetical protein